MLRSWRRRRERDKWSKGDTIGQKWWWWIHWKVFWPWRGCQIEWPVRMCEGVQTDNAREMKIALLQLLSSRRTRGIYKPTRWDPRRERENWPKVGPNFTSFAPERQHDTLNSCAYHQCVVTSISSCWESVLVRVHFFFRPHFHWNNSHSPCSVRPIFKSDAAVARLFKSLVCDGAFAEMVKRALACHVVSLSCFSKVEKP